MYVNSGSYAPPGTMVSAGTFGHQVAPNGASPAPPGAYMAPALVPNIVFRQNVPVRIFFVLISIPFFFLFVFFLLVSLFKKRICFLLMF